MLKYAHIDRLVNHGILTYTEVSEKCDIVDILTYGEWLDIRLDAEWMEAKESERRMKKGR